MILDISIALTVFKYFDTPLPQHFTPHLFLLPPRGDGRWSVILGRSEIFRVCRGQFGLKSAAACLNWCCLFLSVSLGDASYSQKPPPIWEADDQRWTRRLRQSCGLRSVRPLTRQHMCVCICRKPMGNVWKKVCVHRVRLRVIWRVSAVCECVGKWEAGKEMLGESVSISECDCGCTEWASRILQMFEKWKRINVSVQHFSLCTD